VATAAEETEAEEPETTEGNEEEQEK
jgi:hypothetical protein